MQLVGVFRIRDGLHRASMGTLLVHEPRGGLLDLLQAAS